MASKLDIPLSGHSVNIVRQCGPALSDVLQSKYGCMVIIDGVDFEDLNIAQQKRPTVVPEKRFSVHLPAGVEVSVWKADLTNFQVDAVVNAANERLHHCGGLALALSMAGGPQIQKDSYDYIRRHGDLKTGDAVIFDAGLLPCKKIIHAVGPQLFKTSTKSDLVLAESQLKKAICSILDKVMENHLTNVAIPAVSSGLFFYPLQECATTIVATVKRYYQNAKGHLPQEIRLVNNDEPTVREMERACHQILTPTMTYSQAATASTSRGDARTSAPTVQIGNVHLTLKKGNIEDEQTDVIVNTTYNRNLQSGEISSAVLQKAGYGMQTEIHSASKSGAVIITKPYNLKCKQVFHTFCRKDPAQQAASHKLLYESVLECLWLAVTKRHKSIAFPAIGTGGLGFNKEDVANIMSEAVAKFASNCPMKTEVYFVIFPSDKDTYKAFEEQMRQLKLTAPHLNITPAFEHSNAYQGSRAPAPQISLTGLCEVATREAERWLSGLLFQSSRTVDIRNNFIQHFGEQEHRQLSRLNKKGTSIEEYLVKGRAGIIIKGDSNEDVVVAGLQVEAMLCNIQREFVREEEHIMWLLSTKNVSFERKTLHNTSDPEFVDRLSAFHRSGLQVLKVDKVENPTLKVLFDLKKNQLHCTTPPPKMFQQIPAQFCEMVCRVGFHAEYAPPEDPAYGEGIYFARTVKKAMEVWNKPSGEYLHFVEADVLTGNSTDGKPGLILPPPVGTDPQMMYDSVSGGSHVSVIFSGYQALPKYIITCKTG